MSEPPRPPGAHNPFPWDEVMRVALGHLRIPPAVFWTLTLPELDALLRGALGQPGLETPTRAGLASLMQRFPDRGSV